MQISHFLNYQNSSELLQIDSDDLQHTHTKNTNQPMGSWINQEASMVGYNASSALIAQIVFYNQ
jgi:hypothetical protein